MTIISVRTAEAGDAEPLMALRQAYFHSQILAGLLDVPTDVEAHVSVGTPGILKSPRAHVIVADREGLLQGYAVANFRVVPGMRHSFVCSIDEVFVTSQERGVGLAKTLMTQLLNEARNRGVGRTQLRVLAGNPRARALWEQLGFVENVAILEYALSAPQISEEELRHD